ncbi:MULTISPECIES: hypothetical protein [unclassified Leptolyngbya]|uniref:hypothetical protein n=1 Tax=unclassified Leptolyngbya TaxID=2650499 RepID=UPI00168A39B4|nr:MULTISPECIES: hypothetical protein [unclassified Leptolyngbya]MBD1909564.1 hypothetical protein [Leptolyngbya sp. FACHB-8]MBD2154102.1 hypothetical protein [Leptolyngbya sp. FACHB-16]
MLLTAGTFLQEGRYWVEGILEQDETGISYRAQHRNLDISVVIQTIAPALGDRPDAAQILQSFMVEVRRQSLAPSDGPFRVLDCFMEFGQPFVVLDMVADAKPPSVALTWLPDLKETPIQETPIQETPIQDHPVTEAATAPPKQPQLVTIPPVLETPLGVPTNGNASSKTQKDSVTTVTQVVSPTSTKNGSKLSTTRVVVSTPLRRSPSWLPISLGLTALIGGCAGAVFGWQLRQGKSLSEVVPVVGPKVDVDQSFPPIDGWPASKASDIPGSGTDLDKVLQQRTTTNRQERRRRAVEEPPIEPRRIDYGSGTAVRSEPLPEPDYSYSSLDEPAPVRNAREEAPVVVSEPAAVSDPEPIQDEGSANSSAAVVETEPAPITKPMSPPVDIPAPPPETAAPRSFRTNPRPSVVAPSVDNAPAEPEAPQQP